MAKFLATREINFPTQGSSQINEFVKHFESDVSFDDLQAQINVWMLLVSSDAIDERVAIRGMSFNVLEKQRNPDRGEFRYYCQVHYVLIGDAGSGPQ